MTERFSIKTDLGGSVDPTLPEKPPLGKIEMCYDGTRFQVDLQDELGINPNNMIESMFKHSGNYGWWAALAADVKKKLRSKRYEYERILTNSDLNARTVLKDEGHKVTETAVKAYLKNDVRLENLANEMRPLEDFNEFIDMMMRVLDNKRDMLKEINRAQVNEKFNA